MAPASMYSKMEVITKVSGVMIRSMDVECYMLVMVRWSMMESGGMICLMVGVRILVRGWIVSGLVTRVSLGMGSRKGGAG